MCGIEDVWSERLRVIHNHQTFSKCSSCTLVGVGDFHVLTECCCSLAIVGTY